MRFESKRATSLGAEVWCGKPRRVKPDLPRRIRQRLARDYVIHVLANQHRLSSSQIALVFGCSVRHVQARLKATQKALRETVDAD